MDIIDKYFEKVCETLEKIRNNEKENIEKAAEAISKAIIENKMIHVFGTGGHSNIAAEEMFYRSGGLVPINSILDPGVNLAFGAIRSTLVERTPGYAQSILKNYDLKEGDIMIVANQYGINSATIDTALEAKKLGLIVIAITSPEFSKKVPLDHPARHPSKKNLFEIADIVINGYMPFGDAVLEIEGIKQKVAPVSTIINAFIVNSIVARTVEKLVEKGIEPPIWTSGNIPGGDEANKKWIEKYKRRIKHL
ncbi:MAG: SIS domain-containing protein [Candidatus Aenigmatarchaeota archaeon]